MQYKAYLGYYRNSFRISDKTKRFFSIVALLSISTGLILSPFVRLIASAKEGNLDLNSIDVEELENPDFYPLKSDSLIEQASDFIGVDSEPEPTQTFEFGEQVYGFSLELKTGDTFEKNSFRIEFPDGELSEEYEIHESDVLFGDTESETSEENPVKVSELYLFTKGVSKVYIYGNSEVEFEIRATGQEDEGFVKTISASANVDEFSSPTAEITYKEQLFTNLGFNLVTREEWGAPTESTWAPTIADVNRIVIHHTATSVDMSNPKNTVKAIYDYHKIRCSSNVGTAPTYCDYADTWQDIGYNYLIDPYGNVYEGRAGGNGVVGAHAIPNTGSIGISILGNYSYQAPTSAALNSLAKLTARLSQINNFNLVKGSSVFGHRDIQATACPGTVLYNSLNAVTASANVIKNNSSYAKTANSKINEYLASNREYIKKDGKTQLIVDTTGLNANLIEKLSTLSRGIDEISQIDNKLIYTVADSKADQVIGETYVAVPSTKIQPDFIYRASSWDNVTYPGRAIPDDYDLNGGDPATGIHWNLEKINTPESWDDLGACSVDDTCGGSASVVVAVLDTGVAYEDYNFDAGGTYATNKHSGLWIDVPGTAANGTYNEGYDRQFYQSPELAGVNFVNPYNSGWELLCDIRTGGADACNATELAMVDHANDDNGHGTFVTTIIAGDTGNDVATNQVVGIAHNVSIMPVKVMLPNDRSMCQTSTGALDTTCADSQYDYRSVGTTTTIVNGIDHAVANGADVINMSLGGEGTDPTMEAAVDAAVAAGVVVVVSSGNENADIANYFPASFDNVIAVGATDTDDTRSSYSNYGDELDLVAPVDSTIVSRTLNCYPSENSCSDETTLDFSVFSSESTPKTSSGTSFAAPQVSAAVALAKGINSNLNTAQTKNLLKTTNNKLGGYDFSTSTGYGMLDIENMLVYLTGTVNSTTNPNTNQSANGDERTDIIAFNPSTKAIDVTISTGTNFGGGYGNPQVWNSNSAYSPNDWEILNPADVNGDGRKDIIAFNKSSTQVDVTLATSNDDFGYSYRGYQIWSSKTYYSKKDWQMLDPADANGDGKADLIAFNPTTTAIDVTLSDGLTFGGGFGNPQVWNSKTYYSTKDWNILSPADVDSDGDADIVAFNTITTAVDVTLSDGSSFGGGFGNFQVWNSRTYYSTNDWNILSPTDVDGDSDADIVAFNPTTTAVDVTLSDGSSFGGGFGNPQVWNSKTYYSSNDWNILSPADVDGDGDGDIVAFNPTTTAVDVTLSDGSSFGGGFGNPQVWNSRTYYSSNDWYLLN